ncbi:synaptonemal complex central element protein 1 isoform X1 [Epinephelus fuscoguttatus]|uniref:synaptonemal complex central element protein 1 isoform X1 n=2 Tax=Epinephelus fuscoguttatus TaxID=293821 RepID=UPI0020D0D35B|nr:synaptonemal complex central element protein 1 isoform X1 [Epinephelus fuscoguttatus]
MNEQAEFNIDDLINNIRLNGVEGMQEPEVEELVDKIRNTHEANRATEKDIKEMESVIGSLQEEQANLQTEAERLEAILEEQEELARKVQIQQELSEQACFRQEQEDKKKVEEVEQIRCQIEEIKFKHRKLRMKFESQLEEVIVEHKNLYKVFSPKNLLDEIARAEVRKCQLSEVEQIKLTHLRNLQEKLEEMKKQPATAAAET